MICHARFSSSGGTLLFTFPFPGQYFHAETDKHYNYFRDYDPALGRYLQSDPIGLVGGQNTFGYVSSRPLVFFDIWGLCEYMGYTVIDKGVLFSFEFFEAPIKNANGPFWNWLAPKCSWHKFLPPGKVGGVKPPCGPEMIWQDWDLMGTWRRQMARDYEDRKHVFVCEPTCQGDGIEVRYQRVLGGERKDLEVVEFMHAAWERRK